MLSVKQEGIKYHFLSLWYDAIRDWTLVSRAIGEHSTHFVSIPYYSYMFVGIEPATSTWFHWEAFSYQKPYPLRHVSLLEKLVADLEKVWLYLAICVSDTLHE